MKIIIIFLLMILMTPSVYANEQTVWWEIQSIDTMKFSRDLARQEAKNQNFDKEIDKQMQLIADTGATHVAIGTPYDDEFVPFLTKWVLSARKHGLSVWFRGNVSGWEGWFGYPKIGRADHTQKIQEFIFKYPYLFEDGDIFSSCPECENGGSGDPRMTGDIVGHRSFLITEYQTTKEAFWAIGKNVRSNLYSMNGDVAKVIMDRDTTTSLDGIVVIDHYVNDPHKLASDVQAIVQTSGGNIILGEFGAPIPDIHGTLTQDQQAQWIAEALDVLSQDKNIIGLNYWVNMGGTTALWSNDATEKKSVAVIKDFFNPDIVSGKLVNELGLPLGGATITYGRQLTISNPKGEFFIPYHKTSGALLHISANTYLDMEQEVSFPSDQLIYVLEKESPSLGFRFLRSLHLFLSQFID